MALDASLVGFLQVQAGKQTVFGTDVDPDFQMPVVGVYTDAQEMHTAEWDSGVWTKLTIVDVVGQFARFTLNGVLFYEMLPVLFNAGFDEMTPTGGGDGPHVYTGSAAPGAEGDPIPYTFRFGGNDGGGGAESAVEIRDAHMEQLNLVHNLNVKAVLFESEWFGAFVDDASGAGYELIAATVPYPLGMVNGLKSTLEIQDAGTTGGDFETITAFECSLLDWQLSIDTGLRPAWSGDKNQLTYCGPRVETPSCAFSPILRTSGTNYAITKTKADLRAFQELQLTFAGEDNRQAIFQMTGRWLPNFEAHDRSRNEVVMQPTFQVETPHTQTTTPHWLSWQFDTQWEHGTTGITIDFGFRDDFITAESAPIADPRTAEPGPGTSTFIDGAANVSIAGGQLVMGNDAYLNVVGALTRAAGLGNFAEVTYGEDSPSFEIGWDYVSVDAYFSIGAAVPRLTAKDYSITYDPNGTDGKLTAAAIQDGDIFQVGIIRRSTDNTSGNLYVIKGEQFAEWTLFYAGITDTITATQYASIEAPNGDTLLNTWRLTTLPSPFDTANGLADSVMAGVRTPTDTFTHAADFHFEFDVNTPPSAGEMQIDFRMSGGSGYRLGISGVDQKFRLYRLDSGTPTTLSTSLSALSGARRIFITAVGNQIVVYRPGVRMNVATDANYATQTGGIYTDSGTDGVLSDIIVWPWTLGATPAAILDAVFA